MHERKLHFIENEFLLILAKYFSFIHIERMTICGFQLQILEILIECQNIAHGFWY